MALLLVIASPFTCQFPLVKPGRQNLPFTLNYSSVWWRPSERTMTSSQLSWDAYTGHYRNENPWIGSARVLIRKGRLILDGATILKAVEGGLFTVDSPEASPDSIRFSEIVNGKAMHMKSSGDDMWRVMAD
jgi:hypothetical protein